MQFIFYIKQILTQAGSKMASKEKGKSPLKSQINFQDPKMTLHCLYVMKLHLQSIFPFVLRLY